jgi:hypothetical protein
MIPLIWMMNLALAYALAFGLEDAVLACLLSQRFERRSKPFCEPHETAHHAGVFLVFVLVIGLVVFSVSFGDFLSTHTLGADGVD